MSGDTNNPEKLNTISITRLLIESDIKLLVLIGKWIKTFGLTPLVSSVAGAIGLWVAAQFYDVPGLLRLNEVSQPQDYKEIRLEGILKPAGVERTPEIGEFDIVTLPRPRLSDWTDDRFYMDVLVKSGSDGTLVFPDLLIEHELIEPVTIDINELVNKGRNQGKKSSLDGKYDPDTKQITIDAISIKKRET